jgi:enoyl-CoA hydratase
MCKSAPTLKEALITEFRLAARFVVSHDFREGVRAQLVEKDRNPRWQPATLADVTEGMVAACFAPLGDQELQLTDHWVLVD